MATYNYDPLNPYANVSDQDIYNLQYRINGVLPKQSSNNYNRPGLPQNPFVAQDAALNTEYYKRWGSPVPENEVNNPLWGVIRNVHQFIGPTFGHLWNQVLDIGNILGNHPYRQTINGVLQDSNSYNSMMYPNTYTPVSIDRGITATANKATSVIKPGVVGTSTINTSGVGAPNGGYSNNYIDAYYDKIDKAQQAIQDEDIKRRNRFEGEANQAWSDMQKEANAPPPEIDSKNQMFTMLAANIAKVLNPNLDTPGQASQLMQSKLQGMRDQNMRKYQLLTEKYRRASELYDKSGDNARAIQYARAGEWAQRRFEQLQSESHFQQQLAEQRSEHAADRSERAQERIWNRSMERSKNDLGTLTALSERLQSLVNNTKDEKEREGYRTRLTRVLRTMQALSNNQLAAYNNPDGVQPINPDSLFAEMFTQLDASKMPKNRKEMLNLLKHDKNFNKEALRDRWGFSQNEIMDYFDRHFGGGTQ